MTRPRVRLSLRQSLIAVAVVALVLAWGIRFRRYRALARAYDHEANVICYVASAQTLRPQGGWSVMGEQVDRDVDAYQAAADACRWASWWPWVAGPKPLSRSRSTVYPESTPLPIPPLPRIRIPALP